MQSKDKASLNVKCYKRLYHTILWQRDGNSCCFFSHSVQKDKRTCTHFPNHLLGQKWWHIPSPHPATPPSPFGRPCWTTLKLCLDIPLVREAFPHQSLVIYYSTHHETQSFFFYWPWFMAHGISFPGPGIKPATPALEAWNFNHWIAREVPQIFQKLF